MVGCCLDTSAKSKVEEKVMGEFEDKVEEKAVDIGEGTVVPFLRSFASVVKFDNACIRSQQLLVSQSRSASACDGSRSARV